MKKRLIICCDGTWHDLSDNPPSNVVKLMQGIHHRGADGVSQVVYYHAGVGAESSGLNHYAQGAFGWGIDNSILQAYRFLCLNYSPDDDIYLFGYSRGAYTVRSLAGLLRLCRLMRREAMQYTEQAYQFYRSPNHHSDELLAFRQQWGVEAPISFMGCWDTVGTLGIPDLAPMISNPWQYRFHDTDIGNLVKVARHAIAIDEIRQAFRVSHMTHANKRVQKVDLKEMWFVGDHMAVGGGNEATQGLADISLDWMMQECEAANLGLQFDRSAILGGIHPDPYADFDNTPSGVFRLLPTHHRPIECGLEGIHPSVIQRWRERGDYQPPNLATVLAGISCQDEHSPYTQRVAQLVEV